MNAPRGVLMMACLLAFGGVVPARCEGVPQVQLLPGIVMPPPDRYDLKTSTRPYFLGAFDKLVIDVFGIPELSNKKVQLDASGRLTFPFIGVVEGAGRTPGELAAEIASRLGKGFIRNPQVSVNLDEAVSQVITVDGQVTEPGLFPVVGRMTLMQAVARAKGVTEYAKLNNVIVFRTVKGQQMAALYDLKAIRRGIYQDPEVFANDRVIVGNSMARHIFKDILQASPLITTPLIALLR
jgi:polysaccharide export outer membrane protein